MSFSIYLKNISCGFPANVCFEDFTTHLTQGARVALIGRNGCGKSTLLKVLAGHIAPLSGNLQSPSGIVTCFVPQYHPKSSGGSVMVSGGEGAFEVLARAFQSQPDLLLLDEPTTHLDRAHRHALLRMIQRFSGILIVATHDVELLAHFACLWSIEQQQVVCFQGLYRDYVEKREVLREQLEEERHQLHLKQKQNHEALMREQTRAKQSRLKGKKSIAQKKWPTVRSPAKVDRAVSTFQDKTAELREQRIKIREHQEQLNIPHVLCPTFSLRVADLERGSVVSVSEGAIGYTKPIVEGIYFSLAIGERLALVGDNGSGKSTLLKALLQDSMVQRLGQWHMPFPHHIGYIDQHQSRLKEGQTVYEACAEYMPTCGEDTVRTHLSHFLFRSHQQVHREVRDLSGGERMRLSLAQLAGNTPSLLLLDEVTNALDLETREHVMDVLKVYPGALIVISHDESFLRAIGCTQQLTFVKGRASTSTM